ncbi:type II and III secretion system protein family protein [Novosphingobium sp. KCTC 2891]|uniref:type II and III secretion system protein family protein n=1 Tax=Novosphingobium sp. KCTC 2891 TaxID=2989730 RepID=UPI002223BCA5|nr:type II and III secretion system protein family protein [Novosphingobium sp. KCTC 2891]MCW1381596.1 type II and III secretion system protein family protein [Novosphingobium sp. KCTC 2891]
MPSDGAFKPTMLSFVAPVALALCCTSAAVPAAFAQPIPPASRHAGTLVIPLNKSQVVSTDRMIAKAMVGNDEIADVLPITERSIYVLGKKMGTTSLTLYDVNGRVLSIMDVAVGPDVEALGEQLRALVPGEKIEAQVSNESIVLTGTVNDPGAVDRAMQLARAFAGDKVVNLVSVGASQQVMLEVRFAEVSRNSGFDVGVSAFGNGNTFGSVVGKGAQLVPGQDTTIETQAGGTTIRQTVPGAPVLQMSAITNSFGIFRNRFYIGSLTLNATLNALETKGMAKTLAQPTLLALSGERASFLAGGEFPIPVVQGGGGTGASGTQPITVEFKPFGVSLGFTPTVLGDRTINLVVEPEVSAIDPTASFTLGNITIPGLRTRRASTTLELRDGESFAIAGLLQKDFKTTVSQVPLLGSVPIIGSLFRSSGFQKGETELLIVVTPHLVAPLTEAQVRLPTDAVTDPTAIETILMGRSGRAKPLLPVKPGAGNAAGDAAAAQGAPKVTGEASSELPPVADGKKEPAYAY